MDWFLYGRDLRHEIVKIIRNNVLSEAESGLRHTSKMHFFVKTLNGL